MNIELSALGPDQSHADFRKRDFSGMNLSNFDFCNADLRGANFSKCTLHATNFRAADLRGAIFTGAEFYNPALRTESDEHYAQATYFLPCEDCFDGDGGVCGELKHFLDRRTNWMVWDRPESDFIGSYDDGDWCDENALWLAVEPLLETQQVLVEDFEVPVVSLGPDLDSPELDDLKNSIFWSRYAHNMTAFFLDALHDGTTLWPNQEHLNDYPFWNQPNGVFWSPIGNFC